MVQNYRRRLYSPQARNRLFLFAAVGLFVGVVLAGLLTTVVVAAFSLTLPDPNKVIRREGYSTIIYDRNGKVLYDLYNKENRIPLDIKDTPKYLRQATIAIEDKDFYQHQGFSLMGIARAIFGIFTLKGITGGSTLTQQLVKNVLLTNERSLERKIREVILANQIERKFTKDQILQLYLNEAPYGGAYYGVESASRGYFGKSAKDLNLTQSAILAGMPQSPTVYSPYGSHPKAYINRTRDVLRRMREDNYITAQQELDAMKQAEKYQFSSPTINIKAPHFVFYVKELLVEKFGEQMVESGGLRVTTTLDLDLQEQAEKIVFDEVTKVKKYKVGNGDAIVLNPQTGEILAMVGSYDYFDKDYGTYNVTTALRQPGSSGKPFVFATALQRGYTAATMLMDVKTNYPSGLPGEEDYSPANYDGKYRGPMQLRFALGNSINTIAVKLTALVGLKDIMQTGFNAGISTWEPTNENMKNVGLSLALGGREVRLLELSSAYGVFANKGLRSEPTAILKVTDSKQNRIFEFHQIPGKRVFSEEVSFIISHILSDNNARKDVFGEVNLLQIPGHTVAVKTGTTDKKRDNWTLGYAPGGPVVGVWVGNNDNSVMNPTITSGVTGAAPIWNKIMRAALKGQKNSEFEKANNVSAVVIDSFGGGLPHGSDPTRSEYFMKGTEPSGSSPVYRKLKISKSTGKLANEVEIKSGDYEEKEYIVISENDPVSTDGKNRFQDAINEWVNSNRKDDPRFHPPTEKSDGNLNSVKVIIQSPSDHATVDSNDVVIKAKAISARDVVKISIEVDGSEVKTRNADTVEETISMSSGKHKIKVKGIDSAGNSSEAEINIGVKVPWDYSPPATSSGVPVFLTSL